jgi:hypothetical protein
MYKIITFFSKYEGRPYAEKPNKIVFDKEDIEQFKKDKIKLGHSEIGLGYNSLFEIVDFQLFYAEIFAKHDRIINTKFTKFKNKYK